MQAEIAATRGQHERARDCRRPDDFAVHETLDVLNYRIAVIAGLAEAG